MPGGVCRPAPSGAVDAAERRLGCRLPAAYAALLAEHDGGALRFDLARIEPVDGVPDGRLLIDSLAGTDPGDKGLAAQTELAIDEWGVPRGCVALHGDGHTWICLDYRRRLGPRVVYVDVECGFEHEVARDVETFLAKLECGEDDRVLVLAGGIHEDEVTDRLHASGWVRAWRTAPGHFENGRFGASNESGPRPARLCVGVNETGGDRTFLAWEPHLPLLRLDVADADAALAIDELRAAFAGRLEVAHPGRT